MKSDSSTSSWNQVGQDWCYLAQTNDFRMYYIMPYTLQKLGNVSGKRILDLGCGEGGYSRELSKRNLESIKTFWKAICQCASPLL